MGRSADPGIDGEAIEAALDTAPVRLGILFGSQVSGRATDDSDVDLAVAFDSELSDADRLDERSALTADLMELLGTNRVDVADLDAIDPAVGLDAIRTGTVVVGDERVLDRYRARFEAAVSDESHAERMARFESILDRLEAKV